MKKEIVTDNSIYENLGKLYYAIAAADKKVHKEEVNKLRQIVRNEWLEFEDTEDEFGTDAAYQIEVVFDWLSDQSPDAETCFSEFSLYKKENEQLFKKPINDLILQTAGNIASAFSGKNKSELVMLSELTALLQSEIKS